MKELDQNDIKKLTDIEETIKSLQNYSIDYCQKYIEEIEDLVDLGLSSDFYNKIDDELSRIMDDFYSLAFNIINDLLPDKDHKSSLISVENIVNEKIKEIKNVYNEYLDFIQKYIDEILTKGGNEDDEMASFTLTDKKEEKIISLQDKITNTFIKTIEQINEVIEIIDA